MAYKICIANCKGGIGKTTTALNLADQLIKLGKKVLMIDMDPSCDTSTVYRAQIEDNPTLYDIIFSNYDASKCIQTTEYGDIIPGDNALKNADTNIKPGPKMYKYIKKAIQEVENNYDYIIFDTPPSIGVLLGNALMATDGVIIPITLDLLGIKGLIEYYNYTTEFQEDNPFEILGLLIIKYKSNVNLAKDVQEGLPEYAQKMNTRIFDTKIREAVKCQEAQTLRVRLSTYAPNCTTYRDYKYFTDELLEEVL